MSSIPNTPGWYEKMNDPRPPVREDYQQYEMDALSAEPFDFKPQRPGRLFTPTERRVAGLTPRHWLILGGFAAALLVVAAFTMDGSTAIGLVLFALLGALWLSPGIIASKRGHRNAGGIWVVTLLLGWTIVGWVIALAMALSDPGPRR